MTAPSAPDFFLPSWQWPLVRPQVILQSIPADLSQPAGLVRWYLGNQLLARRRQSVGVLVTWQLNDFTK